MEGNVINIYACGRCFSLKCTCTYLHKVIWTTCVLFIYFCPFQTPSNTCVSEKLEKGNPQQVNRTRWEHSLGRTHIYPVSQNKDLVSKFVNFVVCLVMPMTQKVQFTPHALCRTCGWNKKQNIDIYLQSKTTQDEHHRVEKTSNGVIEQQCYFSIIDILQWCSRFIQIV